MIVSKVYSVQFVLIYLIAAFNIEFSNYYVKRLRKESSAVFTLSIDDKPVILLCQK